MTRMSGARNRAWLVVGRPARASQRLLVATIVVALVAASFGVVAPGAAAPAWADTAPSDPSLETVSAAALPTVQIDGVVWDQVIVGNRVYATGEFAQARPAGAALGTNETARSNILAYDLTTGDLITSWAPTLNAQGLEIKASADGATIYVGGDFDRVNGVVRTRVAAIDAQTGALLPWNPAPNGRVDAIAVAGGTVYLGGDFTRLGSVTRTRLAAVDASSGALLAWAPAADLIVNTMVFHPATGSVIVGGTFNTLNGADEPGMGSLDGVSGAVRPWPVNTIIQNHDGGASISSLTTDGDKVYGVGWAFLSSGGQGNLEGVFAADAATGVLDWVDGGRGDNYDIAVAGDVLYTVGHPHDWGMLDWNPQTSPLTWQRAMAIDKHRSPTLTNAFGTPNIWQAFKGRPAAQPLHWLPTLTGGTYTGQGQAAWSVDTNGTYTVLGGEFPRVNGVNQQGLVRFAKRSLSPSVDAIQNFTELTPTATPMGPGAVRIGWTAAWDRDNAHLKFEVLRGPTTATSTVIDTSETDGTTWWNRPPLGFLDTTAPPGSSQTYRIRVTDPFGTSLVSASTTATIPSGSVTPSIYAATVLADNPNWQWRMGEADGTTAFDQAGSNDAILNSATAGGRGIAGALIDDADTATNFVGSSNTGTVPMVSPFWQSGPQTFSLETWLKTSTSTGGGIIGFGDQNNGRSGANGADRTLYMNNAGQIYFGVRPDMGTRRTINSLGSYRDDNWHHVVATLGADGMKLYVDGALVASNASYTKAQVFRGYWRVGGDRLSSWPSAPTREAITAQIDEVAVYPYALPASRVGAHYAASGRDGSVPVPTPTTTTLTSNLSPAPFGATVTFTATVAPSAADGTVQFAIDGTPAGSAVALAGGVATFSTAGLSTGSHQIRATYSGSANFNASTATFTQRIDPPSPADTTTALTSNLNPAPFGASVTFTATVTPAAATGTVQFAIDGTPAGSAVAVTGGVATFVSGVLAPGSHQITASYSGSAGFTASAANITQQVASPPPTTERSGYWMAGADGAVFAFGGVADLGDAPTGDVIDLEPTPTGNGYWIVTRDGTVFHFGDAPNFGDARGQLRAGERVVSMSTLPGNNGYWLFTDLGRVLPFGAAPFLGDLSASRLNGPVLGSIATPSGAGYYMVASDGGVFSYGDAAFYGSMGGARLNKPVVGLVPDRDNVGYWLVASDGGLFAFDAGFYGSMGGSHLNKPVIGMVAFGSGYLMVASDGGIFNFSDKPFYGSLGANPPAAPIVSVATYAGP